VRLEQRWVDLECLGERRLGALPVFELYEHRAELLVVARHVGARDDGPFERLARRGERPQLDLYDRQVEVRLMVRRIERAGLLQALGRFVEPLHLRKLDRTISAHQD